MEINKTLFATDPSRYTVYQLLDYVKNKVGINLVQKNLYNLFLIKTDPYIDSLYNNVHVLGDSFSAADLVTIKKFFGEADFRIKAPATHVCKDILPANGFKLKDAGYVMINQGLKNKIFNYVLPDNVKVVSVDTSESLEHFKKIFAEAFNYQVVDYNRKFGFLDKLVLGNDSQHLKFFVIYENDTPVSTGGYYAFDNFSIENIGTAKSARGCGYASLMMQVLLQEAQRLGYNEACLVGSEMAVSMYQKAGFQIRSKTNTFINY